MPQNKLSRALKPTVAQICEVRLTPPQIYLVNRLYKTGCYGSTPAQVVHRLFGESCVRYAEQLGVDLTAFNESKNGETQAKKR